MSNSPLYARQMAKQFVDNVSVAAAGKEQGFEGNAIASIGGVLEEFLKGAKEGKEKRDKEQNDPVKVSTPEEINQENQVPTTSEGKEENVVPPEVKAKIVAGSPGSNLDQFKASYELLDSKKKAAYEKIGGWSRYKWDQTEGRTQGDNAENEAARAWASRNKLPKGLYLEKRDGEAFRKSKEYQAYKDAGILSQRDGGEKSTKEWNKDWDKVDVGDSNNNLNDTSAGSVIRYRGDDGIDYDSYGNKLDKDGKPIPQADGTFYGVGNYGPKSPNYNLNPESPDYIKSAVGRLSSSPFERRRRGQFQSSRQYGSAYSQSQNVGNQNEVFQGRDGSQYQKGKTFVEKEQYERTPSYWQGTAVAAVDEAINIGRETRNYDAQVLADRQDYANDKYKGAEEEAKAMSLMDPSIRELTALDKADFAAIVNNKDLTPAEREAQLADITGRMGSLKRAGKAITDAGVYIDSLVDENGNSTAAWDITNPELTDVYNAIKNPEKAPNLGFTRDPETGVLMLKGVTNAGTAISYRADNLKELFAKVPTKRSLYGEVDGIIDSLPLKELYNTKVVNGIEVKEGLSDEEIAAKVEFSVDAIINSENFMGLAGDHPAFKGEGGYRKFTAQEKAFKEGQEGVMDPREMIKADMIRMIQEATVTDRGLVSERVTGLASQLEATNRARLEAGGGSSKSGGGSGKNTYSRKIPDNLQKSGAFREIEDFLDDPNVYLRSRMNTGQYKIEGNTLTIGAEEDGQEKFDLNRKEDLARFIRSYGARATGTGKDKFDREIMTSINFIRQNRIERELEAGGVLSNADKRAYAENLDFNTLSAGLKMYGIPKQ